MAGTWQERCEAVARVQTVAAKQQGLFTLRDALNAGVSRSTLRTRLRRGDWVHERTGVFAVGGLRKSPIRALTGAHLAVGPGAIASHRSAAWLWGLTPYAQRPEFSLPRERFTRVKDVRTHRLDDLDLGEAVDRLRLPTTPVPRTLIDLGSVFDHGNVRLALDRAIGLKHTNPMQVLRELQLLAEHGRSGVGKMRAILDEAGVTGSHPPSALEAKTRPLFRQAGLRDPDCELVAGPNGEYRLDFPFPEAMFTVEVDGWQYHSSFDAFHGDRTRQNALTIEGYAFLRYTWLHVTRMRQTVVREVRAAYNARVGLFA
ncbi:MAG: hypothetical protein QOJ00_2156 [Actinomycetota bacterium]|jgi:hypothetical protein